MQKLAPWTLIAALAALTACGNKGEDSGGDGGNELSAEDQAYADALWASMSGYDTWAQSGEWVGVQPSLDGTHGDYVQIWINAAGEATLTAASGGDMAEGTIIAKEGYTDEAGADLRFIAVMQKITGYDADNGDWFYAVYNADGSVVNAGQNAVGQCVACHSSGQDSVRAYTW